MMRSLFLMSLVVGSSAEALEARDTAEVLKKGDVNAGVFGPLNVGLGDGMELQTHPLVSLLSPNAVLRKRHGQFAGGALTGEYGLSVPTYGLRFLQGDKAGGFFPASRSLPLLVVPRLGAVWTKACSSKAVLSARGDLAVGVPFGPVDVPSTGEGLLDLLFAPVVGSYRARLGVMYDRALLERLRLRADLQVWLHGLERSPYSVSAGLAFDVGLWRYASGRSARFTAGVMVLNSDSRAFGGGRSTDFLPTLDLIF
jgi:hypothetical protein